MRRLQNPVVYQSRLDITELVRHDNDVNSKMEKW
jgi:hypothetical protein